MRNAAWTDRAIGFMVGLLGAGCGTDRAPAPIEQRLVATEGFVRTVDSVRLWYRVIGGGPSTVIIPGGLYHRDRFDSLASRTRRVVTFDSRGRGQSDSVPAEKTGLAAELLDLETIRSAVGGDSVAIIAWSGTAYPAFRYALAHPGRVTRLVLFAPVGPRWVPYWDSMRVNGQARSDRAAAAGLAARVKTGEFTGNEAAWCRELAAISNPTGFFDPAKAKLAPDVCDSPNEWPTRYALYVGRLLADFGQFDLRADLGRVTVARLVVHGERDNIPLAGSREWVAGMPNARLLVIKGAAHWPHYEQPGITIEALKAFLAGGWPADAVDVLAEGGDSR